MAKFDPATRKPFNVLIANKICIGDYVGIPTILQNFIQIG